MLNSTEKLINLISKSPNAFFATNSIKDTLFADGFTELKESDSWDIKAGGKYFVTRNNSSIIAFNLPKDLTDYHFQIAASHSDSPCFRVKENSEISVNDKYIKLNTEGYGGMLCSTWFDRPLSVAGRVVVNEDGMLKSVLVDLKEDTLVIPSLAIHMNRKANEEQSYNKQIDMLPLFGDSECKKNDFTKAIAKKISVKPEDIISTELYIYNNQTPSVWGSNKEFISAPRLDDLECAFASLEGFIGSVPKKCINVYACFDNEEVGSLTKQGASSTFLRDTLRRVNNCLNKSKEEYYIALSKSFMLSCDNAHAVHPNHPEKTDQNNCTYINEGIVIKNHSGQKYTTDALSMAIAKELCSKAAAPYQIFFNRSDEAGGSTLGNISMNQVSIACADIGLPQLAMHSAYETAGVKDYEYMINLLETLYSVNISYSPDGRVSFE